MFGPTTPQYTICIEELQRQIIVKKMRNLPLTKEEEEEFETLLDLFHELPNREKEEPGTIHGFCW